MSYVADVSGGHTSSIFRFSIRLSTQTVYKYIKCAAALSFYSFDPDDGGMFIRNAGNTLHLKRGVNMKNNPQRQIKATPHKLARRISKPSRHTRSIL